MKCFRMSKVGCIYLLDNTCFVFIAPNKVATFSSAVTESKIDWSTEQKEVLLEYFKEHISKNKTPTEAEVSNLKKLHSPIKKKDREKIIEFVTVECTKTAASQNILGPEEVNNDIFTNAQC